MKNVREKYHPNIVRYVPPPDGMGHGRTSSAAPWTEEKRRKTVDPPSPPGPASSSSSGDATEVMPMDIVIGPHQVQEDQGAGQEPNESSVFSAEDDIDGEEVSRCYEQLRKREGFLFIMRSSIGRRMGEKDSDETYKRLCELRDRDYKDRYVTIPYHYTLSRSHVLFMMIHMPLHADPEGG